MSADRSGRGLLMMVGVGTMGRGFVRAAAARGLDVAVVESARVIAELRSEHPGLLRDCEVVDDVAIDADESWVAPALRLAARCRPAAVLAFAEPHVLAAALVQEEHGLPGPGLAAALVGRNKALQRARFAVAGVPQPDHVLVEGDQRRLPGAGPWIVKPLSAMGSDGVQLHRDESALLAELDRRSTSGPQLVEAYLPGAEVSWEALVHEGEVVFTNVTRKDTTGPPDFVETRQMAGLGAVDPGLGTQLHEIGPAVVRAVGVRSSVVHVEARQGADGALRVIEMAVRGPGDFLMEVMGAAHDRDVFDGCIDLALGRRPGVGHPAGPVRTAASIFFSATDRGRLAAVDLSGVRALPGVLRAEPRRPLGEQVGPPQASWDRIAYAIVVADGADELEEVCLRAREAADIRVDADTRTDAG